MLSLINAALDLAKIEPGVRKDLLEDSLLDDRSDDLQLAADHALFSMQLAMDCRQYAHTL